jgi:hypothetical protein
MMIRRNRYLLNRQRLMLIVFNHVSYNSFISHSLLIQSFVTWNFCCATDQSGQHIVYRPQDMKTQDTSCGVTDDEVHSHDGTLQ